MRELFERLRADGHTVYLWSGIGACDDIVRANGLEELVAGCYEKLCSPLTIAPRLTTASHSTVKR